MTILVLFVLLFVLMFIGVPIAVSLGLSVLSPSCYLAKTLLAH